MQTQKTNIRETILLIARREFINRGFKKTSIKRIASLSEVAVGNIYNYFKNKDEIFCEVLAPLIRSLEKYLIANSASTYQTTDVFYTEESKNLMKNQILSIITPYRAELKLLFFESSGTRLEKYFDHFSDRFALEGMEYLEKMKDKYPEIETKISLSFTRIACSTWFSVLKEIVSQDELNKEEITNIISTYVEFTTAGWKKILNIKL